MPPIHMTREERASLAKIAEGPAPVTDLPPDHAEKFLNHGLVVRDVLRYFITTKGQLELFRQRYRNMATRRKVKVSNYDFLGRFERQFKRGPRAPTVFYSLRDDE